MRERRSELIRAPLETLLRLYEVSMQRPGAAEVCGLLDATTDDLAFGPTELSVAFSSTAPPAVRCLAEVLDAAPPSELRVGQALDAVRRLAAAVSDRKHDVLSQIDRLAALFEVVYLPIGTSESVPDFRFGVAVEWRPTKPPSIKAYVDLFAAGREEAPARLTRAFKILGFAGQLQLLADEFRVPYGIPVGRGLGLDLAPDAGRNARLYYGGGQFTVVGLHEVLDRIHRSDCHEMLDAFGRFVLRSAPPDAALDSTLVSPVIAEPLAPDEPVLKVDAALPRFFPDDQAASEGVRSLASALSLDLPSFDLALQAVSGVRPLTESRSVLQYCSIDLVSANVQRIALYVRPVGVETPHLSARVTPGSKPALLCSIDQTIRSAIAFLEGQRVDGYAEATHRMTFPHWAGFGGDTERHEGRVFQLALVGNALFEAASAGFQIDWRGLESDVDTIVELGCRDTPGGWRYFPTLPDLPPDVDDLAEVYRLLCRVRPNQARALCGEGIGLVLNHASASDGSFESWIVDRDRPSETTRRLEEGIARFWGSGPDNEVIANFLDALGAEDRTSEFTEAIQRGTQYIVSRQNREGSWPATWYWGDYYGTFASTRLIARAWAGHPALGRVARFLADTVNADEGWGDPESTPIDTALALLAATSLRSSLAFDRGLLRRGTCWLLANQATNGSWQATPFIRMDTNRVLTQAGRAAPTFASHGSRSLGTAFGLRALCATRTVLDDRDS